MEKRKWYWTFTFYMHIIWETRQNNVTLLPEKKTVKASGKTQTCHPLTLETPVQTILTAAELKKMMALDRTRRSWFVNRLIFGPWQVSLRKYAQVVSK